MYSSCEFSYSELPYGTSVMFSGSDFLMGDFAVGQLPRQQPSSSSGFSSSSSSFFSEPARRPSFAAVLPSGSIFSSEGTDQFLFEEPRSDRVQRKTPLYTCAPLKVESEEDEDEERGTTISTPLADSSSFGSFSPDSTSQEEPLMTRKSLLTAPFLSVDDDASSSSQSGKRRRTFSESSDFALLHSYTTEEDCSSPSSTATSSVNSPRDDPLSSTQAHFFDYPCTSSHHHHDEDEYEDGVDDDECDAGCVEEDDEEEEEVVVYEDDDEDEDYVEGSYRRKQLSFASKSRRKSVASSSSSFKVKSCPKRKSDSSSPRKTSRVSRACSHCKHSKTRCDNQRPCGRCCRMGKAETCEDAVHKKRGRKRIRLPASS